MRKKIFLQLSPIMFIFLLAILAVTGYFIFCIYELFAFKLAEEGAVGWVRFVLLLLFIAGLIYLFIRMAIGGVIFDKTEIRVLRNWGYKITKETRYTRIRYDQIKSISIDAVDGKSYRAEPYIVYKEYSGEKKYVNVYYYTKRQIILMIDMAVERAAMQGNIINIKNGKNLYDNYLKRYE